MIMVRLVAAGLMLAAGAVSCSRQSKPEVQVAGPPSVTTELVRVETLVEKITGMGMVAQAPSGDWVINAPAPAQILEMPKHEGDAVKTGDLLVRFELPEITQALDDASSAVGAAHLRVDLAKAEVTKLSALYDKGMIPRNDLSAAQGQVLDAQQALTESLARQDLAKARLVSAEIRAKFAGVVTKTWHVEGDAVLGSDVDPVIRVTDVSRVQAVINVTLGDLLKITPGLSANIAPPGGTPEAGMVVFRPAAAEPGAPSAQIRLAFSAPTLLPIDSPVDAEIIIGQRPDAITIAKAAVQRGEDESTFVYVTGTDNIAHKRPVVVGFATRDRVQILTGLAAGDRVITNQFDLLSDGTAIVIER